MSDAMLEERVQAARTPGAEETAAQVQKLLASPPFQHSDPARRLLTFLAERAATHPGQSVKEIELAISVYDLSPDTFDPQLDSAVRVKVGRLRSKILDYYANFGQGDEVILEVPKGAYCLTSHYRQVVETSHESTPGHDPLSRTVDAGEPSASVTLPKGRRFSWRIVLLLGIALGGVGTFIGYRMGHRASPAPDHLRSFWTGLAANGQPVIVVYSNPRLAGILAHGGLHYYQDSDASDAKSPVNLGYTGAGDVPSVYALTRLFDQLRLNLRVESGSKVSWDSAKDSNLIFIGRPEQNPALDQLPRLREFYFKFNEGIVNAHPKPGEADSYHYSEADGSDYAVIAYIPGIRPQQNTLVLAGNTTWGSLAAVEFMTRDRSMADLFTRLKVKPGQKIPYFEALLKTQINNDVPVWSTIVAVRPHTTGYASWQRPMPDER